MKTLDDLMADLPPARATVARRPPPAGAQPMWAVGVVALLLGAVLWLIGARYTLAGLVYAMNLGLEIAALPARVPSPVGWWWLLALPAGVVFSVAEVRIRFGPPRSASALPSWIVMMVALLTIHGADVGSTYLGYAAPTAGAWPVHVWAAASLWPLGLWAIVLTYLPERLILAGIGWIRILGR